MVRNIEKALSLHKVDIGFFFKMFIIIVSYCIALYFLATGHAGY